MKKTLSFIILIALVLSIGVTTAVFADEGIVYEKLFKGTGVTFTRNERALDGDGYSSGLAVSAKNNGKITIEKFSGEFLFDGRITSSAYGQSDFTRLDFIFQNLVNNQKFTLSFQEKDLVTHAYLFTREGDMYASAMANTTFDNRLSMLSVGFNPQSMEVYLGRGEEKQVIIDLDNEKDMALLALSGPFSDFDNYSVNVEFKKVKNGKEGKLNIYAISGQEFGGTTWVDTKAPVIYTDIVANGGVVGVEYDLNQAVVPTFDLTDGYKTVFKGSVTVVDPMGNPVTVTNGKFIPEKIGLYYATYTPIDNASNLGEPKQASIKVFANKQNLSINYAYPVENQTLGAGDTVILPSAKSRTNIGLVPVSMKIEKDGALVKEIANVTSNVELLLDKGEYLITYSANDGANSQVSESYTIKALDIPSVQSANMNTEIGLGNVVDYSGTVALHSSGHYPVTTVITAPSGETGTFSTYTPTTSGLHKVEFKYTYNSTEYKKIQYFNVSAKESDLWENAKGMKFESGVKSAEYSDFAYQGVLLSARMTNAKAVYKPLIDLTDNDTDAPLFECIVAPTAVGQKELNEFFIILTDKETGDYISIRTYFNQWTDSQSWTGDHIGYVYVTKNTKDTTNVTQTRIVANNYGQNTKNYPNQSIKYYYDYETNSIYVGYVLTASTYCSKVVSLSDLGFNGFTKGQAELSVEYANILSATANILVINVDGKTTDEVYYEDKTGPQITVDYEGNSESDVPVAIVSKNYPYFNAMAEDSIDGKVPVEVKVYYVDQNGQSTLYRNLTQNGFIPTKTGRYDIVYSAHDYSGNTSQRIVTVNAKLDSAVADLSYQFGAIANEVKVGSIVAIPDGISAGGTGKRTVNYKVLFNGESVATDGRYFNVEIAGEYTVQAIVTDYLKVPTIFSHTITVVATNQPVIKALTMPKGILLGRSYTLPNFTAKDYSSGVGVQIPVVWKVNGVVAQDGTFTPETAGNITITATATGEAGETSISYDMEVLTSGTVDVTKFTNGYFELNGTQVQASEKGLDFTANGSNGSFAYHKSVLAQDTLLKFTAKEDGKNYSSLKITLTDAVNSDIQVEFSLTRMDDWTTLVLLYNPDTKTVLNGATEIATFDKCVNGEDFSAFTSGEYFVKVEFIGVSTKASITVSSVGSQSFTGNIYFAEQFFVTKGFDVSCDSSSIIFNASERAGGEHSFEFYKPIIADGSYFRFKVDKNNNDFTSFVITMTDSLDKNVKVSFEVTRSSATSTTSKLTHNGVEKNCAGDWYSNTPAPFEFKYNANGKYITDYQGTRVANLTVCDNGDEFKGFTSGYYYLSIEIKGLESNGFGSITLNSIMNQPFSNLVLKDVIKPNASFKTEFTFAKYGETLVIPSLNAYDVLGEITNITLSVTAPDGTKLVNAITAWDGYSIEINQYGTYKIEYLVYDNASIIDPTIPVTRTRTSFTREFTVYDRVQPVITISGSLPKTVKVGDNIKLPTASVYDNYKTDITYKAYITDPSGNMVLVNDQSYRVEREGRYTVIYYAIDDDGAFDMQRYTFTAVK